jgi:hypothetical protein
VPWHHAACHRADDHEYEHERAAGGDGVAETHAATLDPAGSRTVHEAEELLKQWWSRLQPLYPTRDGEPTEP